MTIADQPDATADSLHLVPDATCTFCGCTCDDIELATTGRRIVEARRACELGKTWFLAQHDADTPSCRIAGQPADVDAGIEQAAQLLAAARYPLVYGLAETTCEAQRLAVSIADWIGACVDTPTSSRHGPIGLAFQGVGEVTSSLGEVANRGDLVIFWGTEPGRQPSAPLQPLQPAARGHVRAARPGGPHLGGRRRPPHRKRRLGRSVLRDQAAAAISRPCGSCALWRRGVTLDAQQVEHETGVAARPLAGSGGPHEAGPVRRDVLRHGADDDRRPPSQQRSTAGTGS